MTTHRVLTLCALLLLSRPLSSQLEPGSEPTSLGPLGGSAISIAVHPSDPAQILVVQYTQGLFRSVDAALTFSPYGSGISAGLTNLTQDPSNGLRLFALDGDQLFRSEDFGATWAALPLVAAESPKSIALSPAGGDILVVDAFNVYHSPDGGSTWNVAVSVVPFGGDVLDKAVYSADGTVAYLATNDGVRRSADSGASFAPSSPLFDEWVQCVTVSPTNADTVYVGTPFDGLNRSTDGGVTFSPIGAPVTDGNSEWFSWDPDGRLWYATLTSLVYSADGGDTWFDGTAGWPDNTPIAAAMAYDSTGLRYFGCEGGGLNDQSGGGLYRMPAGAPSSWEHIGFLIALINDLAIAGPGGERIIGIGSGVYSGGAGQVLTPTAWHFDIGTDTRAVAVDPSNPDRWVTGGVGAFFDNAQIVVLTNGGDTFVKTYETFGAGIVQTIEFDPSDPDRVVAGIFPGGFGNPAVIVSFNGGDSWGQVGGTAGWATRAVAFDPHTPGRVMQLSDNNQWAQSLNGGANWSDLQPAWPGSGPACLLAFDPHTPGVIFRGDTGTGLWLSIDDGANWGALGIGLHADSDIVFHPDQPDLFWVSASGGQIMVSADGGNSFDVALDVPLGVSASAMALDTADGTLLVGTAGASTWELPGASPVLKVGEGTPGSGGFVPSLTLGGGLPQLGNPFFSLAGDDIVGDALVYMALGFTQQPLLVFGGVFQIGSPVWRFYAADGAAGVGGAGSFDAPFPLPVDPILMGVTIYAQLAIPDVGVTHPSDIALSNALSITFHD